MRSVLTSSTRGYLIIIKLKTWKQTLRSKRLLIKNKLNKNTNLPSSRELGVSVSVALPISAPYQLAVLRIQSPSLSKNANHQPTRETWTQIRILLCSNTSKFRSAQLWNNNSRTKWTQLSKTLAFSWRRSACFRPKTIGCWKHPKFQRRGKQPAVRGTAHKEATVSTKAEKLTCSSWAQVMFYLTQNHFHTQPDQYWIEVFS